MSSSDDVFVDDDEETLSILLRGETVPTEKLRALSDRVGLDHENGATGFRELQRTCKFPGLGYTTTSDTAPIVAAGSATDLGPEGALHLQAVTSVLGVSETVAVQLTVNCLVQTASDKNAESLLGTATLLQHVLQYYYSQRVARLCVLCELLRTHQAHGDVLDALDGKQKNAIGQPRGLFGLLLTAVCQPDAVVQRQDFEPVQKLATSTRGSGTTTVMDDGAWRALIRECMERKRAFQQVERLEALEALLVLLYNRMPVQRQDLALLVTAFSQRGFSNNSQLARLAGLILVESMALWRIFSTNDEADENNPGTNTSGGDWRASHPILQGNDSSVVDQELQALVSLLRDSARSIGGSEVPEALALLSFGLLLNAADSNEGMELAKVANNEYDAFGYLHTIMEQSVVPSIKSGAFGKQQQLLPYELRAGGTEQLLLEEEAGGGQDTRNELSAPSLAYASIGRELLVASIFAFQNSILPTHKLPLPENVSRLSNLVLVTFRHSPTLCERFWSDWEVYTSSKSPNEEALPLCRLLSSAHRLASAALKAKGSFSDDAILNAITPLLQIASSFAYDAAVVEDELAAILPRGLIRCALLILSSRSIPKDADVFADCREKVLESLSVLTRVGNTSSCRALLRLALEEEGNDCVDGPRTLASIATASNDPAVVAKVFAVFAQLIEDAPFGWLFDAIRSLKAVQDKDALWRGLFLQQGEFSIQAVTRFVDGLVCSVGKLVFSGLLDESVAPRVFSVIRAGALACAELLPASLSSTSRQHPGGHNLTYGSAALIMDCLRHVLQEFRPIVDLNKSTRMQDAATDFLDCIVRVLAGKHGMGQAICLYATSPASLSLAASLEAAIDGLSAESDSDEREVSVFSSFHRGSNLRSDLASKRVGSLLLQKLADVGSHPICLEEASAKRWLDEETSEDAPLHAALSAMRLLNWWAKSVAQYENCGAVGNIDVLVGLSPSHLLEMSTILPSNIKAKGALQAAWTESRVSVFSLLLFYFGKSGGAAIEGALAVEAFDFVSISLFHGQISSTVNSVGVSPLAFNLCRSAAFKKVIIECQKNVVSTTTKRSLSADDKLAASIGTRYLRVLGAFLGTSPFVAAKILDTASTTSPIVESLVEGVFNVVATLENADLTTIQSDSTLSTKLRVATGCLGSLRAIWRLARLTSSDTRMDPDSKMLVRIVEGDTTLVECLAAFVFNSVGKWSSSQGEGASALRSQGDMLSFMTLAIDVLATELFWAKQAGNFSSTLRVVRAIEKSINGDLFRVVEATKSCFSVNGFLPLSSVYKSLSTQSSLSLDRFSIEVLLRRLSGPSSHPGCESFISSNGYDTDVASHWFAAVNGSDVSDPGFVVDLFSVLSVEYNYLSSETCCLQSWKAFVQMLQLLLKTWRLDAPEASLFSVSTATFSLSMTKQVLFSLGKNLSALEQGVEVSPVLIREGLAMASDCAGLALASLYDADFSHAASQEDWIELVGLVSDIAKKVSHHADMMDQTTGFKTTMKHLFVSAALLCNSSQAKDSSAIYDFNVINRLENIYVELASAACKVIRTIKPGSSDQLEYFCSCAALLAAVVKEASGATSSNNLLYSESICRVFKEFDVIKSLVFHAISNRTTEDKSSLLSVLGLFTKIAASGDPNMLSLLVLDKAASVLLTHHTMPEGIAAIPLRGYRKIRTPAMSSVETTNQSDPAHEVWRASLQLVSACLRSSSSTSQVDDEVTKRFSCLAIDFFQENRGPMVACLKQCSSVGFGPVASKQSHFTLNVLREASLVLAIVAELCNKPTIDMFKRGCPDLFNILIEQSASLVASLSTFLGASGSSRDIFRALAEVETADSMTVEQGPHFAALSPVHRLLAGGLQNAKHEAIRYSSLVLNCSRAVTQADVDAKKTFAGRWKQEVQEQTNTGSPSMTTLEQKCRGGVTSKFSFQMELEAAECLFFAAGVLWKTHPASSSFVMYTEEEAAHLDAMRFVKPGMVIAFRRNIGRNSLFVPFGQRESLSFARVLSCDTVNRQWNAQLVKTANAPEECLIDESQLAGIEDSAKRVMVLSYKEAPDSSSTLEEMDGSVSIGSLILALRWCGQFYFEDRNDVLAYETGPAIIRLAELMSSFVGLELSLHLESCVRHHASAEDGLINTISNQVLDLFGTSSEFGHVPKGLPGVSGGCREGRLLSVLSGDSWNGARSQLQPYLDVARSDISLSTHGSRPAIPAGSLFSRRRTSSSSNSPYAQGIGN